MELVILITMLCFFFSAMLLVSPCASLHIDHLQPSLENQVNEHKLMISLPTLPRKLMFTVQVKEHEGGDFAAQKEVKENLSRKQEHNRKQNLVGGRRGTRQEWEEESDDPSQYFTMDYSRVRRRRHIHNKHNFPLGP